MACFAAVLAVVAVGAHKQAAACVVHDHLVEVALGGAAQGAGVVPALHLKRVVFKIKAAHRGVGRYGVKPLFTARAKELQGRVHVHLGVVKLRNGRGRHQVTLIHHHRVVIGSGNGAELRNVLVQAHMHEPVFGQGVHLDGLAPAGLQA